MDTENLFQRAFAGITLRPAPRVIPVNVPPYQSGTMLETLAAAQHPPRSPPRRRRRDTSVRHVQLNDQPRLTHSATDVSTLSSNYPRSASQEQEGPRKAIRKSPPASSVIRRSLSVVEFDMQRYSSNPPSPIARQHSPSFLLESVSVDSAPNLPSRGFGTLSPDDLFGLQVRMWSYRTVVDGTQATHLLDPYHSIFGCNRLLMRLCMHVLPQLETSIVGDTGESHIFWHASNSGSGAKTFIDNICLRHRINLCIVSTSAPRTNEGLCPNIRYTAGKYLHILETAIQKEPCIIFLDRVDSHFDSQYTTAGHELIAAWDSIVESSAGVPLPRVWIVISHRQPLASFRPNTHNPFNRLRNWESVCEQISAGDCFHILANCYAYYAAEAQVLEDDRPPHPSGQATPEKLDEYQYQLEASQMHVILKEKDVFLHRAARLIHEATTLKGFFVIPSWLNDAMRRAFYFASERVANEERKLGTPLPINSRLPTEVEMIAGVHCIGVDFLNLLEM